MFERFQNKFKKKRKVQDNGYRDKHTCVCSHICNTPTSICFYRHKLFFEQNMKQ